MLPRQPKEIDVAAAATVPCSSTSTQPPEQFQRKRGIAIDHGFQVRRRPQRRQWHHRTPDDRQQEQCADQQNESLHVVVPPVVPRFRFAPALLSHSNRRQEAADDRQDGLEFLLRRIDLDPEVFHAVAPSRNNEPLARR